MKKVGSKIKLKNKIIVCGKASLASLKGAFPQYCGKAPFDAAKDAFPHYFFVRKGTRPFERTLYFS